MRKVFLDDLPRWGKSGMGNEGTINWEESIGYKVSYVYNDKKGEIKIINYEIKTQSLIVEYENNCFNIKSYDFKNSKIGRVIGGRTNEFKLEIGCALRDDKRDLIILDREYRDITHKPNKNGKTHIQKVKYYKYKCNKCGYDEGWTTESLLINRNASCACCKGRVAILGINTIWDTNKEWVEMFGVSEKDAKTYTKGSGKLIEVTCPNCGNTKKIKPDTIRLNKSIGCFCGDSFSYCEKVMANLLIQLNVEFETQVQKKILNWCEKYRYDFYLPEYKIIIETHGDQHYSKHDFRRISGKTFKDEQKNDKLKKELAINNGIKEENYVVIDCRYSDLDWIKNKILDSRLNSLFELSKVDWIECERFALKNRIKEICDYWNDKNHTLTTGDLSKIFKIDSSTINRYLKKGTRLGWTEYDSKQQVFKVAKMNGERSRIRRSRAILAFKGDFFIGEFSSAVELEGMSEEILGVKLNKSCIRDVANGKREKHKGFTFKYVD